MPDLSASLRDLIEGSLSNVDVDGIVRVRRRRRRVRRAGSAAAVLVIAALATGGLLARPVHEPKVTVRGGPGPKVSEADATRAALAGLTIISPGGGDSSQGGGVGPVNLTDPSSDRTRQVPFPIAPVQSTNYPFVVRGSNIVMTLNTMRGPYDASIGTAYVASSTFGQWRAIGSSSYTIASAHPDRVWLVSDNSTPDQRLKGTEYGAVRTVVEEGLDGSYQSQQYPLTDLRSPIAAVADGLVTSRPGGAGSTQSIIEVWDPVTDRVLRTLPVGGDGNVIASSRSYVAWAPVDCPTNTACALHITDVRSGADRAVMPPRGLQWSPRAEAFSPDGSRLALVATPPPTKKELESRGLVVPPGTRSAAVVIVDAATGSESSRRSATWEGVPAPSWSPDGSLVFVVRDRAHVGYFNTLYVQGPVREVAVPDAGEYLVAATHTPPSSTQHYAYDGLVSQSLDHSPELCVYGSDLMRRVGHDNCSGPAVAGWDWTKVKGATSANGVTSGSFHVVGTYDGGVFTLTGAVGARRNVSGPPLRFPSACPTPAGGWKVVDPRLVTLADYTALNSTAQAAPDYAGMWLGPSAVVGNTTDLARSVINIASTGNVESHRRALASVWGGPICVLRRPHSYAELERVAQALLGVAGKQLGLQIIGVGPDDLHGTVHAEVIAVNGATQRAVDERFGKGVVVLNSTLHPVG